MWKILWIFYEFIPKIPYVLTATRCIEICGEFNEFYIDVLKYVEKFMDFAWM